MFLKSFNKIIMFWSSSVIRLLENLSRQSRKRTYMLMLKLSSLSSGGQMGSERLTFTISLSKFSINRTKLSISGEYHTVSEALNWTKKTTSLQSSSMDTQFMQRAPTTFLWTCFTQDWQTKTIKLHILMKNCCRMLLIQISTWSGYGAEDNMNLKSFWSLPQEKVSWFSMTSCSVTVSILQLKPSWSMLRKKLSSKSEGQETSLVWPCGQETMKFSKESTIGDGENRATRTTIKNCSKLWFLKF